MTIFKYNNLEIDTEELTAEDMPNEVFSEIFELCGADAAVSILINMRGNLIQVPAKGGLSKIEKKIILDDYDGTTTSIRKIARRFGITEGYIRKVLANNKIQAPLENQMPLGLEYSHTN